MRAGNKKDDCLFLVMGGEKAESSNCLCGASRHGIRGKVHFGIDIEEQKVLPAGMQQPEEAEGSSAMERHCKLRKGK